MAIRYLDFISSSDEGEKRGTFFQGPTVLSLPKTLNGRLISPYMLSPNQMKTSGLKSTIEFHIIGFRRKKRGEVTIIQFNICTAMMLLWIGEKKVPGRRKRCGWSRIRRQSGKRESDPLNLPNPQRNCKWPQTQHTRYQQ